MQAAACGLAPDLRFNPVLLKPGSDRPARSCCSARRSARSPPATTARCGRALAETAFAALAELRAAYDVVICEGAGSPAEINLRAGDFVNMGLARHAGLPDDRGRRHRPGRRLRRAVRHRRPARRRRPGADRRLRDQQVPRRPSGCSSPGLDMLHRVTGRPVLRGAAVAARRSGSTPRTRSRTAGLLGRPGAPRGTEWLRRRGRPAAADLQRHRRRGARRRAGRAGAAHRRARRARRRRPGRAARLQVDRRRPGLAAARPAWPTRSPPTPPPASRCSASAAASRCWPRASTTRWRAGRGTRRRAWACCRSRSPSRRARPSGPPAGTGAGRRRCAATRSTTATSRRRAGAASRCCTTPTVGPRARCSARCTAPTGTARSSPTGSAAGSSPRWPRSAGRHGFTVAPDTRFAAARERSLDLLGDLVEEHLDTAALWRLDRDRRPRRPAVHPARRPARPADRQRRCVASGAVDRPR